MLSPGLATALLTLVSVASVLPRLAAAAPPSDRPEAAPGVVQVTGAPGNQTILRPWGTVAGMRVDGEWIEFEGGLRVVRPDWSGFSSAVKYLQRPEYSRTGDRRRVTSSIENLNFTVSAQERAVGEAELEIEATVPAGLTTAGIFWCFEVPAHEFARGSVEVLPGEDRGRTVLTARPPGAGSDYLQATGQAVRLVGRRQRIEINLTNAVEVRVRREASDHPTALNDPKVAQKFVAARDDDATPYQVYLKLAGPDAPPDGRVAMRLTLRASTVADGEPARLTLDATQPGQPFDGIGGNFRLQFPKTDPGVIQYNLDRLRVAWGRVDMPWADWAPDESASPLETARGGRLPARVREAMAMAQTLSRRGLPVIVSAWYPPRWARSPVPPPPGARGVALDEAKLPRICRSLADYLVLLKESHGVEAMLFSLNEPETGVEVRQTPEENVRFVRAMGAELKRSGLKTKMLLGDTAHGTPAALDFIRPALADSEARTHVGAVGFHTWRGCTEHTMRQWSDAARGLGVPLLATEAGPDAHLHEYPGVRLEPWFQLQEIDLYLRVCAHAQPATIMEWQLTTDYSVLKGGGVYGEPGPLEPTQRFWNLKQLGMTPPGARALPIASDQRALTAAAFGEPDGVSLAVHLVNNGGRRRVVLGGLPESVGALRCFVTDATRGMEESGRVEVRGGKAEFVLAPASYATLLGDRSMRPLSEAANPRTAESQPPVAPSPLILTSSSDDLADGFAWAKRTALSKVHPDNGGCYQAALPDRGGYCQRDFVHQIDGAALLGLSRENLAMLRCFASHQTEARGWFTLWEINYDGTPMACDYRDDQHFWRNTAGMFDLLHGAYRQYRWTANPALVEDPVLQGFYARTVNDFVAAHDRDGNGIVEGRSGTGWGIACTYNEMPGMVLAESADSLGTQRRAFEAYAQFLLARGDRSGAEGWAAKARGLQRIFNDTWYDAAAGRYRIGVDDPGRRPVTGFGYETSWFIPYTGLCEPGARATAYLDFIHERFQAKPSPNIEAWTYLPDVFYSWNQNERGWQYFKHVLASRSRYPEVSFTVISQLATRILGIEPDAPGRAVTTLGRLPAEVAWAELDHVPVGSNDILVRHENRNRTTTLVNHAGPDMTWEAVFPGEHPVILVDDVRTAATAKALHGTAVSSVTVKVTAGQRRVVKVPEPSSH